MNLVDRAKNIIMTPKTEWAVIAGETPNVSQIITGYVIPLALIPLIATILGGLLFTHLFSTAYMIAMAVGAFIVVILAVFLTAYVIDFLAPNFGSEKNIGRAVQLVAYSYTPGWVAGILNIIPALGVIAMLASIYSIYLMYLGLPVLKKTPADKVVVYLVVAIVVLLVIYFILLMILGAIIATVIGVGVATGTMGM